jgi:polyhydroxybutyrate depolymerase
MFNGMLFADLQTGLQLEFDGRVRTYDLFIPSLADSSPQPLVLDLHGLTSNATQQRDFSGLDEIAGQQNFYAAWPNGFAARWNSVIGEDGTDDVGFLRALVDEISSQYTIDPARIYVTGLSQGGVMVSRLACEANDLFAAFASVAGSIVRGSEDECSSLRPVPFLAWRGENDDVVPYQGGIVQLPIPGARPNVMSAQQVFDFWRAKNECGSAVGRENLGSDSFCDEARNCGQDARTRACTVQGSGDGTGTAHIIYNNTAELDLSQEIWEFFAPITHPNPSASPFTINAGLNDAWFDIATNGQGFLIVVFPERSEIFLAWFTYDIGRPPSDIEAILGDPGHRWLTALGPYDGNQAVLDVYQTFGGIFDSAEPSPETGGPIGTIEILWSDCENANLTYQLDQPNVSGSIELRRITEDNVKVCEALTGQ